MSLQQIATKNISSQFDTTVNTITGNDLNEPLQEASRLLQALLNTKGIPSLETLVPPIETFADAKNWFSSKDVFYMGASCGLSQDEITQDAQRERENLLQSIEVLLTPSSTEEEKVTAFRLLAYHSGNQNISTLRNILKNIYPDKNFILTIPQEEDYAREKKKELIASGKTFLDRFVTTAEFTKLKKAKEKLQNDIQALGEEAFKYYMQSIEDHLQREYSMKGLDKRILEDICVEFATEGRIQDNNTDKSWTAFISILKQIGQTQNISLECATLIQKKLIEESDISEEDAEKWARKNVKLYKRRNKPSEIIDDKKQYAVDIGSDKKMLSYIKDFYRMINGKVKGDIHIQKSSVKGRSYVSFKTINIFNNSQSFYGSLWHELAHRADLSFVNSSAICYNFIRDRATGQLQDIGSMTEGVPDGEMAYPDHFATPYIGKIYRNSISEVFSMFFSIIGGKSGKESHNVFCRDEEFMQLCIGLARLKTDDKFLVNPTFSSERRSITQSLEEIKSTLLNQGIERIRQDFESDIKNNSICRLYNVKPLEIHKKYVAVNNDNDIISEPMTEKEVAIYSFLLSLQRKHKEPSLKGKTAQELVVQAKDIDKGNIPLWFIE